jgi:hypothetical protein
MVVVGWFWKNGESAGPSARCKVFFEIPPSIGARQEMMPLPQKAGATQGATQGASQSDAPPLSLSSFLFIFPQEGKRGWEEWEGCEGR